ncbi:ankyrin repeat-containing domain protein [Coprinopsis sp. MPI-PUGE-AT-0042]|nr:ankyrin repeat-containing domain protein [Coprinopsis sp. MPI-PUGE-AT-0042]
MLSGDLTAVPAEAPSIQYSGPAIIQGTQNLTINGGTIIQNNEQVSVPVDPAEHLRKVLDFLSLVNFRTIQQENHSKWTPDTLKWLLEGSMFQWWLETKGAVLWGTGMPGTGKTILASVVIQDSEDHAQVSSDICVGFVYCRYTEPLKVRDILAALVRQLLERYSHLLPVVEPLYAKHSLQRTNPTQSELVNVIREICKRFTKKTARFFIDGLDEALYDEQFDLLNTLKSVPANFFITSRPLLRLNDVLPNMKMFDIAAQNADIELLVLQHIQRNPDLREVLVEDKQRRRVIKKICQSSHGMFLHASLMVEAISHCFSAGHVMEQLDKLPAKLGVLYEASFSRIEAQPKERAALAKRVLVWVAYAYRPLTVEELQHAVARDQEVDWQTPERLVRESLLVSVCCGLVAAEGNQPNRIIRLVHYTALDALKRILSKHDPPPHCQIAETCVRRLIHCWIPARRPNYRPIWDMGPPLLEYAYESWHLHAKDSIHCVAEEPEAPPVASMLRFLSMCTSFPAQIDLFTAPIHLVTYYHFPSLFPLIDAQINMRTRGGRSALSLAAWQNDPVMAKLLLKQDGIEVNLQDMDGNTALMLAAGSGFSNVVKVLLLDPRVDINKRNWKNETALNHVFNAGIDRGHTRAALNLIETPGIDINAASYSRRTPLMAAAGMGWADIVKALLMDPRVDLHKRNEKNETALHCALAGGTSSGHTEAALHLIAAPRVDINAADDCGRTPLMVAYEHPPKLLDALARHPEIDPLRRDKDGLTALMHVCDWGSSSAVEWYLQLPGVDAKDSSGASALARRALNLKARRATGFEDPLDFRPFIDAGFDVNEKDSKGFTALTYAILGGPPESIDALLGLGVDVNVEDREGRTLLMITCEVALKAESQQHGMPADYPLRVLLRCRNLDVNARNRYGMTAVAYAIAFGVLETAQDVLKLRLDDRPGRDLRDFLRQFKHGLQIHNKAPVLHEVPGLTVDVRLSEHSPTAEIVVTGIQAPYPPGFTMSYHGIWPMAYGDRVIKSKDFPWSPARISDEHAECARLLRRERHDLNDDDFRFLRHR